MKTSNSNNLLKIFQWILPRTTYFLFAVTLTKTNQFENIFAYLKTILWYILQKFHVKMSHKQAPLRTFHPLKGVRISKTYGSKHIMYRSCLLENVSLK